MSALLTACVLFLVCLGLVDSNLSVCLVYLVNTPAGLYDWIAVIYVQRLTRDRGKQRCLLFRPAYQMALKDKKTLIKLNIDSYDSHYFIVCP